MVVIRFGNAIDMTRDYRFDIARVLCMTYIVAFLHLYGYVYNVISANVIPSCHILCDACLGLFTFTSGYLLGKKYCFGQGGNSIKDFYVNRVVRIIPLFLLASLVLCLIGFNSAKATLYGILCLSPFLTPRPKTLWYIPVIIICYLITPMVCRKDIKNRICNPLIFIVLVFFMGRVLPVDERFVFNVLFYLLGMATAPCFTWKFSSKKGLILRCFVVVLFVVALVFCKYKPWVYTTNYLRITSALGVFAVLFLCDMIAKMVFPNENEKEIEKKNRQNHSRVLVSRIVKNISYASMACYMFHRFFFWVGEKLWNPNVVALKWVYMAGMVFPIMLVLSYYIQKGYDFLVVRIEDKNYINVVYDK